MLALHAPANYIWMFNTLINATRVIFILVDTVLDALWLRKKESPSLTLVLAYTALPSHKK